jgi:hypothetical protein
VIDSNFQEGHALQSADFLGLGYDQLIAGSKAANKDGKIGGKLHFKNESLKDQWNSPWIDANGIACEYLQIMDLNGDVDQILSQRAGPH